jgi:hypothetical protein
VLNPPTLGTVKLQIPDSLLQCPQALLDTPINIDSGLAIGPSDLDSMIGGWDENAVTQVVAVVAYKIQRALFEPVVASSGTVFHQHKLGILEANLCHVWKIGGDNDILANAFKLKNLNCAEVGLWDELHATANIANMSKDKRNLVLQASGVSRISFSLSDSSAGCRLCLRNMAGGPQRPPGPTCKPSVRRRDRTLPYFSHVVSVRLRYRHRFTGRYSQP